MQLPCFLSAEQSKMISNFATKHYDSSISITKVLGKLPNNLKTSKEGLCIHILNHIAPTTMSSIKLGNYLSNTEVAVLIIDYMAS